MSPNEQNVFGHIGFDYQRNLLRCAKLILLRDLANQWTGFYMIGTSVTKELLQKFHITKMHFH